MYVQNRDRCLIARHPGPCECRKRQGRFQARPGEVPGSSLGCDLVPRWDQARAGRRVSRRWRQPHANARGGWGRRGQNREWRGSSGERKWTDRKEKRTWTRERASHGVHQPRPRPPQRLGAKRPQASPRMAPMAGTENEPGSPPPPHAAVVSGHIQAACDVADQTGRPAAWSTVRAGCGSRSVPLGHLGRLPVGSWVLVCSATFHHRRSKPKRLESRE